MEQQITLESATKIGGKLKRYFVQLTVILTMACFPLLLSAQEKYIGEETAKAIALKHAKLTEKDVTLVKIQLDKEDRIMVYEIEFYTKDAKYDYEIEAIKGTIREYKRDIQSLKHQKGKSIKTDSQYISKQKAKEIALNHAKLSASSVKHMWVKLDRDDGIAVYEVEFKHGNTEYEYDIDAQDGTILKNSSEKK